MGQDTKDFELVKMVAEICMDLEQDGLVKVDWSPNSTMDRPRCSAVYLTEVLDELEAEEEDLVEFGEEDIRRQLAARDYQVEYFEGRHDADKREITRLTELVEQLRERLDATRSELRDTTATLDQRTADCEEAQRQLRQQTPSVKVDDQDLVKDLRQEVTKLTDDNRTLERRLSHAERDRDLQRAAADVNNQVVVEARVIRACHDRLHTELGIQPHRHLGLSRSDRRALKRQKRSSSRR